MTISIYDPTANEPKVRPIIRNSFAFLPTAGMRLAPEVLILELMRDVFYDERPAGTQNLDPDEVDDQRRHFHSGRERAVLCAMRGRRKKIKNFEGGRFYAPAYPQLAKRGWLGKKRERVIESFLFSGPVAQNLWHKGVNTEEGKRRQQEVIEKVWRALVGGNSPLDGQSSQNEFLALALDGKSFQFDTVAIEKRLKNYTESNSVMKLESDELASRITNDLLAICGLEKLLPRMQWLQLLMTFLRFALPMWLLAQMQVTRLLHEWFLMAVDGQEVVNTHTVLQRLECRNRGLLHPTLTATRELIGHIENYVKCRVELNILLKCLEIVRPSDVKDKVLTLVGGGKGLINLEQLLVLLKAASSDIRNLDRFKTIAGNLNLKTFLTREGEQFAAWRAPLSKGQGKNIDEFFRVLYKADFGDEAGGYLFVPEGRGVSRGFRAFPGQLLLKTVTYLAAQNKDSDHARGGGGKLVLEDVEEHFAQYGVDFSMAADARPLLMNELQAMGLLTGSPDAGSSVAVARPY